MMPPLPGEGKSLTADEEVLAIALRNKNVHARAKYIMMQFLEQIKDPDRKLNNVRSRLRDMT